MDTGGFQTGAEQSLLQDKVPEHPGMAAWIWEEETFGAHFEPKWKENNRFMLIVAAYLKQYSL